MRGALETVCLESSKDTMVRLGQEFHARNRTSDFGLTASQRQRLFRKTLDQVGDSLHVLRVLSFFLSLMRRNSIQ